jgi:hypothetical protein
MRSFVSILFVLICSSAFAQGYQHAFSSEGSDYVVMISEDVSGNTWIAGTTNDTIYGYADFFLIKTNASGDTIFTRTYSTPYYDFLTAACLTSDGGILLSGNSLDSVSSQAVLAMKISASGGVQWSKQLSIAQFVETENAIQTSDGGYLLYGNVYASPVGVFLIKLNPNGMVVWDSYVSDGISDYVIAGSVQEYSNGYAFVATIGDTTTDTYIAAVNFSGTLTWSSYLGLTNCAVTDFKSLGGGHFVLAGYATNVTETFLAKVYYDSIEWAYTYSLPGAVYPEDMAIDQNGNILMTGGVLDVFSDMYLIKTDSLGTRLWGMQYFENSYGIAVSCAGSGDYLLGGGMYDPGVQGGQSIEFVVRTDSSGASGCGNYTVDGATTVLSPLPYPVSLYNTSGIISANYPVAVASGAQQWNLCPTSIAEINEESSAVYPNPFSNYFEVNVSLLSPQSDMTFNLYDAQGRLVRCEPIDEQQTRIERENLPAGIYFYRILNESELISTGKIIAE